MDKRNKTSDARYVKLEKLLKQAKEETLYYKRIASESGKRTIKEINHLLQLFTEHKKVEEELRESEKKHRVTIENVPGHILVIDRDSIIEYCNRPYAGLTQEQIRGTDARNYSLPENQEDMLIAIEMAFDTGGPQSYETEISGKAPEGSAYWETRISPVLVNGKVKLAVLHSIDITERKKAEKRIKASLKEKEMLLREIHHRVKNNMQVISSLLSHQADNIEDKNHQYVYYESINRVKTMAVIHELLYQSEDFSQINFEDYINRVCENLISLYQIDTGKIRINTDIKNIYFSIDTAISCGLIINELVSNSLKHAFPDNHKGDITITVKKVNNKRTELKICDNGIGIPETFNWKSADTLGLHLVNLLAVDQLEGEIELTISKGTEFRITLRGENASSKNTNS
ncbi:sensor histidine kinase [Candidatus Latescibacterota bacterium]